MFLPPQSSERPPSVTVPMRPPSVSLRSTTEDANARCAKQKPAGRPEAPPPTTIQRSGRDMLRVLKSSDRKPDAHSGCSQYEAALRDDDLDWKKPGVRGAGAIRNHARGKRRR